MIEGIDEAPPDRVDAGANSESSQLETSTAGRTATWTTPGRTRREPGHQRAAAADHDRHDRYAGLLCHVERAGLEVPDGAAAGPSALGGDGDREPVGDARAGGTGRRPEERHCGSGRTGGQHG
jgi:hypothetical protein